MGIKPIIPFINFSLLSINSLNLSYLANRHSNNQFNIITYIISKNPLNRFKLIIIHKKTFLFQ